jgi:hypothetical protein
MLFALDGIHLRYLQLRQTNGTGKLEENLTIIIIILIIIIVIVIIIIVTLRCFQRLHVSWLKSKLSLVPVFLSLAPVPCM